MSLQGFLATMSVADLFDWIDRKGIAGEVTLERAGISRRFTVGFNHVTGASSTNPTGRPSEASPTRYNLTAHLPCLPPIASHGKQRSLDRTNRPGRPAP